MIRGIGNDIVEIERIEKAILHKRFLEKYFTDEECTLFKSKNNRAESIAGNFAVKEAVSKVFGTGFVTFGLRDIEVLRDNKGKPYVELYGGAKDMANSCSINQLHVSISHSEHYVVAIAIGEGD